MDYRHLRNSFALLAITLAFGTFGYTLVEQMDLFEAFYMTVITISTVGFSEIKPLTVAGRVITIIIISTGVTIGGYTIGMLVKMFVEGELAKTFGRKKLEKQISELKNHFIVCGFGRIGKIICKELRADSIPFAIIEQDPSAIEDVAKLGYPFLKEDATSEEALMAAGIMRAKGIVTAVQSDADNVFITLSAKALRPDVFILSRASSAKNEEKLKRAGATRVVSPYEIGGSKMAQVLKRPTVVDFLDVATMGGQLDLMMEEARVREKSSLIGKNLIESHLRQDYGVIIVAIKKPTGEMIFNPKPSEVLDAEDVIVVLGKKDDLLRMNDVL